MASQALAHGMGTFFKDCEHPRSRWSKCPHTYKIRYRDVAGRQKEEAGYTTQERAVSRLTELYNLKKTAPRSLSKIERVRTYGPMRFEDYAREWRAGQRDLGPASLRHLDSLLAHHLLPAFASRRMDSFDHKVIDRFVQGMEAQEIGQAAQLNAFEKLKAILLDAHKLGLYDEDPLEGVKPPQYAPDRAVIPSPSQLRLIRDASNDTFRLVTDLMSGCGLRNGEALAVNLNNLVANDVYRVCEQVNQTTQTYAPLKHRKRGDYRDVPLPASVRETIERYAEKHGDIDGYLLRNPKDAARPLPNHSLDNLWRRVIRQRARIGIPNGMVLYGLRHFFASNCLTHGIPITDVAEWMGHRSVDITFRIYRHLLPGSIGRAAETLNLALAS
ncbi:tyrosine-type recombinase/integrase [Streptomyces sulphureus]|uniref:tyrosine-type recombinase/integrase n=1 Tax=Streptomyces sulphureus TaxID=47758 RepID=UPI0003709302|nr:tyrosine-type recombinase/integrase [Streptomyces sulphureus]